MLDLTDSSGHGLTLSGGNATLAAAGLIYGDVNKAMNNGTTGSPSRAGADLTGAYTAFSWEFWFKTTNGGTAALVGRSTAAGFGTAGANWFRSYMNSGKLITGIFNSSYNPMVSELTSPLSYNDNSIHHVVNVWDGSTLKVYVDNTLIHNVACTGTLPANNAPDFQIGRMATNFPA